MIPDEPIGIAYLKDGSWVESQPRTNYFRNSLSG
jgi:hypothetical protein